MDNNSTDFPVNQNLYFWLELVNLIDLIVSCLAFTLCACSLWLLTKRQIFHINLMILVLNFHFLGLILVGGGIIKGLNAILDFSVLIKPSIYPSSPFLLSIETLRIWSAFAAILSTTLAVIERMYATFHLDSYERTSNRMVIGASILAIWIFSIPCIIFCFHYSYFLCSAIFFCINTVLSGVNTLILNVLFYMMMLCNRVFVICVVPSILLIAAILVFTDSSTLPYRNYIIREGFHLIVCFTNFLLLLCFITSTQDWRLLLRQYLSCHFCWKRRSSSIRSPPVFRIKMQANFSVSPSEFRLALNMLEERDMHFRQLELLWV